jgi:hypothetical protein
LANKQLNGFLLALVVWAWSILADHQTVDDAIVLHWLELTNDGTFIPIAKAAGFSISRHKPAKISPICVYNNWMVCMS